MIVPNTTHQSQFLYKTEMNRFNLNYDLGKVD